MYVVRGCYHYRVRVAASFLPHNRLYSSFIQLGINSLNLPPTTTTTYLTYYALKHRLATA